MKRSFHASAGILLAILMGASDSAQAWDWLTLSPLKTEAILRLDASDQSSSNDFFSRNVRWEAGVRLEQAGYILDPGIARFGINIEPLFTRSKLKSTNFDEDRDGNAGNYVIDLHLLERWVGPVSFDFVAIQNSSINSGSLGSRYENKLNNYYAGVNWENPAFPMRFYYENRSTQQENLSAQGGFPTLRDDNQSIWTLTGQSSKMRLLLEHMIMDDLIKERNQDYITDRADLAHTLPWGTGSYLRSRFDFYNRSGFSAYRRAGINEFVTITHTANLTSYTSYRFTQLQQTFDTSEHDGSFGLSHNLWGNLDTSVGLDGFNSHSDNQDVTYWRAGINSRYSKKELFGGNVNASVGYSYQETDRDSKTGLLEVVNESQVITLDGTAILNQRFIINSTIIVTNSDSTVVYTEGFDYLVFELTDNLTQIQAIPGGRINPGDTILASYKALTLPSQEFSTTFTNYGIGYNLGWFSFSHFNSKSKESLLSGISDRALRDNQDVVTKIEFNWTMGDVNSFVAAERRFYRIGEFETTNYNFRQTFTWSTSGPARWNLSLFESFSRQENRDTDTYNLQLTIDWRPLPSLSIHPTLGAWKRQDKVKTDAGSDYNDQFITAGFTMRWQYRLVSLDAGYHYNRRTTNTNLNKENRVMFNLRRKFR